MNTVLTYEIPKGKMKIKKKEDTHAASQSQRDVLLSCFRSTILEKSKQG